MDEEPHEKQAGQYGGALTQFASAAAVKQYAYATHCSSHVLQATPPVLHALLQLVVQWVGASIQFASGAVRQYAYAAHDKHVLQSKPSAVHATQLVVQ